MYPQPVQNELTKGWDPDLPPLIPSSTMPTCSATCKDGGACTHKAKPGHSVCGKHMAQDHDVVVVLCGYRMANGRTCANHRGEGLLLCGRHHRLEERRAARQRAREVMFAVLDAIWTDNDPLLARQRLLAAVAEGQIDEGQYENLALRLDEEIAFWEELHVLPQNVVPVSDLHRLALDGQNVHTKEVTTQTNEGLEILLNTPPVDIRFNALEDITWEFCDKPWRKPDDRKTFRAVLKDMRRWYETPTCREENDWLYKRVLDGLYARIQASPLKEELIKRVWEEAVDSLGMCCDGHITRLCNVLVGFDEAFKPPVSVGEILQQKMAAIAAKDITVERKVGEAWVVFEDLGIPREQRLDWLEAF